MKLSHLLSAASFAAIALAALTSQAAFASLGGVIKDGINNACTDQQGSCVINCPNNPATAFETCAQACYAKAQSCRIARSNEVNGGNRAPVPVGGAKATKAP